jgi:hypothetical protein
MERGMSISGFPSASRLALAGASPNRFLPQDAAFPEFSSMRRSRSMAKAARGHAMCQ